MNDLTGLKVDTERFWRDGYLLLPSVFSAEEVEKWRGLAAVKRGFKGDMLTYQPLAEVIYDARILAVARQLLGGTPVYFGDSSISVGENERGFHKDNADRYDGAAPDWRSRYTLIRFGIYLQDHSKHSGGLNVRRHSHEYPSRLRGRTDYMKSTPGDLVVWNLRTTHSAGGVLLRHFEDLYLPPALARLVPDALRMPSQRERIALFTTYGLKDDHMNRYLSYLQTRRYMVDKWRESKWEEPVISECSDKPLELLDYWSAIKDQPVLGQNVKYAQLPY